MYVDLCYEVVTVKKTGPIPVILVGDFDPLDRAELLEATKRSAEQWAGTLLNDPDTRFEETMTVRCTPCGFHLAAPDGGFHEPRPFQIDSEFASGEYALADDLI